MVGWSAETRAARQPPDEEADDGIAHSDAHSPPLASIGIGLFTTRDEFGKKEAQARLDISQPRN